MKSGGPLRTALERVVPLSVWSRAGEYLNGARLWRVGSRDIDFSHFARLDNLNIRSILDPGRFNSDWIEAHNHIQSVVLAGQNVVHSPNVGDLRAIYQFVRHLKPRRVLEVGTCLGACALYIGTALQQNAAETARDCGALTTIDIRDVNDRTIQPLATSGLTRSPREAVVAAGLGEVVHFVIARSYDFLRETNDRFDFVYLDGSTAAADVYRDLQNINHALDDNAVVLQHAFFPNGRPLWDGEHAVTGPWRAVRRFQSEGAPLAAAPLGQLPWPTKKGSRATSLALLGRGN